MCELAIYSLSGPHTDREGGMDEGREDMEN